MVVNQNPIQLPMIIRFKQMIRNKYSVMKKFFLIATLGIALISNGQKFEKVSTSVLLKQYESAKGDLDKIMNDPKAQSKPDGWFWKATIYAYFYSDEGLRTKYPGSETIADEAFQKYIAIEPSLKLLKDNNGQSMLFNLYAPSFNNGISTFNAKNWDSAYYYFSFAVKYSDVIFQNKFSKNQNQAFDTTSILYAGFAAQNAQKPALAVKDYDRLINSKVGGPTYIDIYKYCLINSINTKNDSAFKSYLSLSKAMYPNEDWEDYELTYFNKNYSLAEKAAMYDKEDASGSMSAKKYLQYGEIFANVSKEDKEKIDSAKQDEYLHKAADAFKKAFNKDNDGISAYNAGIIYYNIFGIFDDKVSQAKRALQDLNSSVEADPKKKASVQYKTQVDNLKSQRILYEKPMGEAGDSSIIWLEKAFTILKDKQDKSKEENNCLNKSVDYLSNIFIYKRDKARGKDPKAFDVYDAKFKLYDSLHDKFN